MSSIKFEHIKKVYDNNTEVVKDFNLYIDDKEFVILVGPSGCGKSTTLRMIAGLEEITDGKLYIGDKLVNDMPPKDRDIAMVFQNYALYPHMSVFKNMAFGLELRKTPKDEIKNRVKWAAEILGISDLLDRKPKTLSGGQRQRVALGRAMVRNPSVFLLDEPLSNLDARLRVQMRTELIKLHKKLQTTFIYVTHDQSEALSLSDRILLMRNGSIIQLATPYELYEHPKSKFAADFIGDANIFTGEILGVSKGLANVLIDDTFHIILKDDGYQKGESVTIVIRPENMNVTTVNKEYNLLDSLIFSLRDRFLKCVPTSPM